MEPIHPLFEVSTAPSLASCNRRSMHAPDRSSGKMSASAYVAEHRRNFYPSSGEELESMVTDNSHPRTQSVISQSSERTSERPRPIKAFKMELAALRTQNHFYTESERKHICFFTGLPCHESQLQHAHLIPHSETRMANLVRHHDWIRSTAHS